MKLNLTPEQNILINQIIDVWHEQYVERLNSEKFLERLPLPKDKALYFNHLKIHLKAMISDWDRFEEYANELRKT